MSLWNGHCACTCYHLLFVFNQFGDLERCALPAPPARARRCFLQQARDVRAMDQGGQRRDQVDAAVVPDVRRQRGAAPASCPRLQPRQFLAHAGDAGAGTPLKDKLIKIGAKVVSYGRYVIFQMAEVAIARQMFQEILRLIAELRPQPPTSASVRRSMSCIQEQPTEGVRPNARENGQIRPSTKRSG
jgi:hypothetical protein